MTAGTGPDRARWLGGIVVLGIFAAYYLTFFAPPISLGTADPDRYYHLAISRITAEQGLVRVLPQVEDLGWGRYFPDKEFLFHVLTGGAYQLGGSSAVLAVVPLLGLSILLCLYLEVSRVLRPLAATLVCILVPFLTSGFMLRLTLLRPHMLAILWFCCLLASILRGRPRAAALASFLFVLSYHAFYLVILVAGVAWLLRNREGLRGKRVWLWCLAGLVTGLLVNPYFPTNVHMGWLTLKLALGMTPASVVGDQGLELVAYTWKKLALTYGFIPLTVAASLAVAWPRRSQDIARMTGLWFLLIVTLGFWIMGTRSPRAMEYATPACVLLLAYAASLVRWRYWLPTMLVGLVAIQGYVAVNFYRRHWEVSPDSYPAYEALLRTVPHRLNGVKIFNCEWEGGSYILHARPDLRFVDLLEPTLLWQASSDKSLAREGLRTGRFEDPRLILRGLFKADYVICGAPKLIEQMEARRGDFTSLPGTHGDSLRLFAVRPD